MPMIWFAKDGPRPNSQSGPGTPITADEAVSVVGSRELTFVGTDPPSINVERPSRDERNVVLQVGSLQECTPLMPKVGFYLVVGLEPSDAKSAISTKRGEV